MRRASITLLLLLTLTTAVFGQAASDKPEERKVSSNPDEARIVTSDIDLFWKAYDRARPENNLIVFRDEYLRVGSYGLKQFTRLRIGNSCNLVDQIEKRPRYYASIRQSTLKIDSMKEAIRVNLRRLKELYPEAVFPDIYFLIGRMNSGGTLTANALLIGSEMYARTATTPTEEMNDWERQVIKGVEVVPHIVTHELIHYQQKYAASATLLARSMNEGAADYIAELVSGGNINDHLHRYGNERERELWEEFKKEMDANDVSRWLYQGDQSKDRPADLGYYMGYKIAEAYYKRAADKKQAVKDILQIKDFHQFLAASGYAEKFKTK